jgi:hypothetical protein
MEENMTQLEPIKLDLDTTSVGAVLQAFDQVLMLADQQRAKLADAGDWQSLAYGLAAFRDFKANLDTLMRAIEDDVAAHLPEKKVVVDNFGTIERRSATSRRWDSEGLLQYMVRDVLDPDHTGEVNYDRMWDLIEALKKALPFTASLGWRVTALKDLNMPVDLFSETTYGRQTITIAK